MERFSFILTHHSSGLLLCSHLQQAVAVEHLRTRLFSSGAGTDIQQLNDPISQKVTSRQLQHLTM